MLKERMKYLITLLGLLLYMVGGLVSVSAQPISTSMVRVDKTTYTPFFDADEGDVTVPAFMIDEHPVTHQHFLAFVVANPSWRRSNVSRLFADAQYLLDWESDTNLGSKVNPSAPVTQISWFAARAYAKWVGKRLPTLDEWEIVAMADQHKKDARQDSLFITHILSWYERPNTASMSVKKSEPNVHGVYDLNALVWEWTEDFNSVLITGESRNDKGSNNTLFCGGGSVGVADLMNYAAFMRFAFRGSLKPTYSIKNLGFRCVKDIPPSASS